MQRPQVASTIVGVLVTAAIAAWLPASALANGAETIRAAPQLPIGQTTTSGWSLQHYIPSGGNGEWWRVEMVAGDKLTIDAEVVSTGCGNEKPITELRMYAPSVTDFTLSEAQPAAKIELDEPSPLGELTFVAPLSGDWSLSVGDGGACATLTYSFTARLQHRTTATLNGPRTVRARRSLTLAGTISGATGGTASIQLLRHGWKTVGTASIGANGTFRWVGKTLGRGSWHYRVVFAGDASHLASQASHSITVH